jgi:hypothetical protein
MSQQSTFLAKVLPRYRCHKEVQAFKIKAIEREQMPTFLGAVCKGSQAFGTACGVCERCKWCASHGPEMTAFLVPAEDELVRIAVGCEFMRKHNPEVGGYFVLYADGYESYSPAKAFEEGYTRISG